MDRDFAERMARMTPDALVREHYEATLGKQSGNNQETERHRILTAEMMRRLRKLTALEEVFRG